jgi:hypothetical protein
MRRSLVFAFAVTLYSAVSAQAQVGMPGIEYSGTVAGGDGVQLYPYDQQDPWLHGYYQRYPAYGGFASYRPYNYRHVLAQTQIASGWGGSHGMPYSHQFWNKYRSSYLDQNLHSQAQPGRSAASSYSRHPETQAQPLIQRPGAPFYPASTIRPIAYESAAQQTAAPQERPVQPVAAPVRDERPVHIFPGQ